MKVLNLTRRLEFDMSFKIKDLRKKTYYKQYLTHVVDHVTLWLFSRNLNGISMVTTVTTHHHGNKYTTIVNTVMILQSDSPLRFMLVKRISKSEVIFAHFNVVKIQCSEHIK